MATVWNGNTTLVVPESELGSIEFEFDPTFLSNISDSPQGVVFTTQSGHTLTITGVTMAEIAEGDIDIWSSFGPNNSFSADSAVVFGDGTSSTLTDNIGNDINVDGTDFAIVAGMGGGDNISAWGDGNHFVLGGRSISDSADGADNISTGWGSDVVSGNAGDDHIYDGGGSNNVLHGGSGDDYIEASYVWLGEDEDAVTTHNSRIYGGNGADEINVWWATGTTTVYGGNGVSDTGDMADNIYVYSEGQTDIFGNAGGDTIDSYNWGTSTEQAVANVYGGAGGDIIYAQAENEFAAQTVVGGLAADTIDVDAWDGGHVTVYGGGLAGHASDVSADIITFGQDSSGGVYDVFGGAGNDDITGETSGEDSNARVNGEAGDDTIAFVGDAGTSAILSGGLGADTIGADAAGKVVIFGGSGLDDTADGADIITASGTGEFAIFGNAGADEILASLTGVVGSEGPVGSAEIHGGRDDDKITVRGGGTYEVNGGVGNDTLTTNLTGAAAGHTYDTAEDYGALLTGGAGADTFVVTFDASGDVEGDATSVTLITDYDIAEGDVVRVTGVDAETDPFTAGYFGNLNIYDFNGNGTEDVVYQTGDDALVIDAGGEMVTRVTFADGVAIVDGSGGANTLSGGTGNDLILDLDGALDQLNGGAGHDTLIGGEGRDELTGGTGNDTFYYFDELQSTLFGYDTITDFVSANDQIDLSEVTFGTPTVTVLSGDQDINYDSLEEAVNAFADGGGANSEVTVFYFNEETYVFVDNSSNDEFDENDMLIHLDGVVAVTAADFNFDPVMTAI